MATPDEQPSCLLQLLTLVKLNFNKVTTSKHLPPSGGRYWGVTIIIIQSRECANLTINFWGLDPLRCVLY